jgi:hypothetical protein
VWSNRRKKRRKWCIQTLERTLWTQGRSVGGAEAVLRQISPTTHYAIVPWKVRLIGQSWWLGGGLRHHLEVSKLTRIRHDTENICDKLIFLNIAFMTDSYTQIINIDKTLFLWTFKENNPFGFVPWMNSAIFRFYCF